MAAYKKPAPPVKAPPMKRNGGAGNAKKGAGFKTKPGKMC